MKPVMAYFRQNGILCVIYMDDIYVQADSTLELECQLNFLVSKLESLGFYINYEKSALIPSKQIMFLGFIINSEKMTIQIPDEKSINIKKYGCEILKRMSPSIRDVATLIGLYNSSVPATIYGSLHFKYLEICKIKYLRFKQWNFDESMILDENSRNEIHWWNKHIINSEKPIVRKKPVYNIQTDSSKSGWGGFAEGISVGGNWSSEEATLHINILETKAILLALKSFSKKYDFVNTTIHIQSDNSTAVSYVKHFGGTKSLECNDLAQEIWTWCENRNIWLTISHLAGSKNCLADEASRLDYSERTEWSLDQKIFNDIVRLCNVTPSIDLFASRLNYKLDRYAAWHLDPNATFIDAFSFNWHGEIIYCFPPFCLLSRCIQKILTDGCKGIIIAPIWPTQPWFSQILDIICFRPIILPARKNLLKIDKSTHPLWNRIHLTAFIVSSNCSEREEFLMKQPKLLQLPGSLQQENSMEVYSESGQYFVVKDRQIFPTHL
ncbi:hypothetical protein SNE40_014134 [Patella caerulea]|uniref:Reverse transcriptase domain-containing protein n=1 Tax=Patella caerulea TaxID=87958 RepID=A0AAN8JD03_PATCE